jgi:hypothetical protein
MCSSIFAASLGCARQVAGVELPHPTAFMNPVAARAAGDLAYLGPS